MSEPTICSSSVRAAPFPAKRLMTRSMAFMITKDTTKQYTRVITTDTTCPARRSTCPAISPPLPSQLYAATEKIPTAIAPQIPPIPCRPMTSRASSTSFLPRMNTIPA